MWRLSLSMTVRQTAQGDCGSICQTVSGDCDGGAQGERRAWFWRQCGNCISDGMYFKVVDSDDWLEADAYRALLKRIEAWCDEGFDPDLLVCDYTYNHLEEGTKKDDSFQKCFSGE